MDGGADITSYQIEVRADEDTGANSFTETVDGSEVDKSDNSRISNLPASRTEYKHSGLKAEQGYYYRIRALNDANGNGTPGEEGEVSPWTGATNTISTRAADIGTHGPPTGVGATAGSGPTIAQVVLTWTAPEVPGTETRAPVTRYEIQWQQSDETADDLAGWADATIVTPTPPTNIVYKHTGVEGMKRYVYRVRAVNSVGPGEWSAQDDADTAARDPDAPALTASVLSATEVLLQWNIPAGNGTTITSFDVRQWVPAVGDGDGDWGNDNLLEAVNSADSDAASDRTHYTVDGLVGGTTYYFRIQALPGGAWSAEDSDDALSVSTTMGVPGVPTLTATTGDDAGTIALTIEMPMSTGGSDITGYQLQRWYGGQWTAIGGTLADDATSYEDTGLMPGATYYYSIRAINSSGAGAWSDIDSATAGIDNPDAPTLTATTVSDTSIRLNWNEPNNNGTTITTYELQRWDPSQGDDGAWGTANLLGTSYTITEYINIGLDPGTKHYYRVRAMPQDDGNNGTDADAGWSADDMDDAASAATLGATPSMPQGLAATQGGAGTINLNWTAPTTDNGFEITGYEVYRWGNSSWNLVTTTDDEISGDPEYADEDLDAGSKHYYIVRAMNSQGAGAWSAIVNATVGSSAPDTPVLTLTPTGTSTIQISWAVPAANGDTIVGYVLEKWDGTDWESNGNLLGTTGQPETNRTIFVDSGLEAGTEYWYRIRTDATTDSANSVGKSARTFSGAPDRPVLTATADGHDAINLSWTVPENNGSDIIRYDIELWNSDSNTWGAVPGFAGGVTATVTSVRQGGLTAETRYIYRVRAVNRASMNSGLGSWSTLAHATTGEAPE
jgi:titin